MKLVISAIQEQLSVIPVIRSVQKGTTVLPIRSLRLCVLLALSMKTKAPPWSRTVWPVNLGITVLRATLSLMFVRKATIAMARIVTSRLWILSRVLSTLTTPLSNRTISLIVSPVLLALTVTKLPLHSWICMSATRALIVRMTPLLALL